MTRLTRREAMKTAVAALTLPLVDECGGEVVHPPIGYWLVPIEMQARPVIFGEGKPYQKTIYIYPIAETLPSITAVKDSTQPNTFDIEWLK